jgi:hypothetical protein
VAARARRERWLPSHRCSSGLAGLQDGGSQLAVEITPSPGKVSQLNRKDSVIIHRYESNNSRYNLGTTTAIYIALAQVTLYIHLTTDILSRILYDLVYCILHCLYIVIIHSLFGYRNRWFRLPLDARCLRIWGWNSVPILLIVVRVIATMHIWSATLRGCRSHHKDKSYYIRYTKKENRVW